MVTTDPTSPYQYEISRTNTTVIMVKPNSHKGYWKVYGSFDTTEQAQRALLMLERPESKEGTKEGER